MPQDSSKPNLESLIKESVKNLAQMVETIEKEQLVNTKPYYLICWPSTMLFVERHLTGELGITNSLANCTKYDSLDIAEWECKNIRNGRLEKPVVMLNTKLYLEYSLWINKQFISLNEFKENQPKSIGATS